MEAAIKRRNMLGGKGTFSLAIDATKVAQVLEVSHAHGAINGGEHTQHMIPIDGMDNIKVQELWDGKLEEYGKVSIEREVKVKVMSFQDTPSDFPTMEVVAGQPQSKSASNDFIKDIEYAASAASVKAGDIFANFTVDGVSCESDHVWITI